MVPSYLTLKGSIPIMANPWIDISYPIENGIPQWPGDPPIEMSKLYEIGPDCRVNVTRLSWVSHFMTHVDAPLHFIKDGAPIDKIPLDTWSGDAVVIQVDGDYVEERHIPEEREGLCLLFKTRNGELWPSRRFEPGYVYISEPAARLIARRKVKLVGVDYLSVDKYGDLDFPAHYAILGAGIVILEAIDLRHIEPGPYELVAFPLKITGCDGSPARAALRRR